MNYQNLQQQLEAKKSELLRRVNKIDGDIYHRENPLSANASEQAVELENLDVLFALDKEGKQELSQINNALMRMESEEYDVCTRCGNTIPDERLEAIPYTDLCFQCASQQES